MSNLQEMLCRHNYQEVCMYPLVQQHNASYDPQPLILVPPWQLQVSIATCSAPSSVRFNRWQNGLLARRTGPYLIRMNGIGQRAVHKMPNKLHAQPMPSCPNNWYVASGSSRAATIFRLNTDEANAEAE